MSHPFSVAVFKDNLYWDDWKNNAIFVADKDHGVAVQNITGTLLGLMEIKVSTIINYYKQKQSLMLTLSLLQHF